MNTLCAAVTEGTRVVGNVSGFGPLCFTTVKAVDILRQNGSSWRTRHFCVYARGLNSEHVPRSEQPADWITMYGSFCMLESVRSTMVDVVICRSFDRELVQEFDSEAGHRE